MNNTLNTTLATNLEANFNTAIKMSEDEYDYQSLIDFLHSDKIVEKQIAILKLTEIKSQEDAQLLTSNLVGQDGKIREAVAFKINELITNPKYTDFFLTQKNYEIFTDGIMDINGNVCRLMVELTNYQTFKKYLCDILPGKICEILNKIKNLSTEDKRYVISKRNFQLYWSLEALYSIIEDIEPVKIIGIILKTGEFDDYTIREKTAKIIANLNCLELNELKEKLKNDENYYVRRYLINENSCPKVSYDIIE